MGNIGGEIAAGAAHAMFGMITAIPIWVYAIILGGLILFGILMRYLTNVKVDAVIAGVAVILCLIFYYRAHWIDQGYAEAQAKVLTAEKQMAGFRSTEKLIENCYAQNTSATYLWDRTKGQCLRADGSN